MGYIINVWPLELWVITMPHAQAPPSRVWVILAHNSLATTHVLTITYTFYGAIWSVRMWYKIINTPLFRSQEWEEPPKNLIIFNTHAHNNNGKYYKLVADNGGPAFEAFGVHSSVVSCLRHLYCEERNKCEVCFKHQTYSTLQNIIAGNKQESFLFQVSTRS